MNWRGTRYKYDTEPDLGIPDPHMEFINWNREQNWKEPEQGTAIGNEMKSNRIENEYKIVIGTVYKQESELGNGTGCNVT